MDRHEKINLKSNCMTESPIFKHRAEAPEKMTEEHVVNEWDMPLKDVCSQDYAKFFEMNMQGGSRGEGKKELHKWLY